MPLLRDARALLAPIEWNEPFGLTLIEAMLSGLPGGRVPPRQRARAGRARRHGPRSPNRSRSMVRFIRPGGAVDRLSRRAIRAAAVARFNHRRMAAEYERLYNEVIIADTTRAGRWPITAA